MGKYLGILSFENGFVTVSDVMQNMESESFFLQINDHTAVVLANDIESGKKFCEQYLLSTVSNSDGFDKIISIAMNAFENLSKEYAGKILTLHFLGYDLQINEKSMHSIMFNGTQIIYNSPPPPYQKTIFTFEVNLGTFIVNKVYSNYMSVREAVNLMGYVSIQYRILYPQLVGKNLIMHTISESGIHALSDNEIKKVLENSEAVDVQIRKDCSDFFFSNNIGVQK